MKTVFTVDKKSYRHAPIVLALSSLIVFFGCIKSDGSGADVQQGELNKETTIVDKVVLAATSVVTGSLNRVSFYEYEVILTADSAFCFLTQKRVA